MFRTVLRSLPALATVLLAFQAQAAVANATFKVSTLTFARPTAWEWVPTQSTMRQAQLKVPNPSGEAGEVVFFHFGPGGAGGTAANIERWFRQFEGGKAASKGRTEEATVSNTKVTYVHAEGTYLSGMPGGPQTPKPGFAMLAAIVEDPAGHVFVRFTGPKAVVEKATEDFKGMITGFKR